MLSRLHAILLLSALIPLPVAATTFKIATIAPEGSSWMSQMREGAAKVQRRTEGRVSVRFYPGGIMGNDQSVLRKIRIGQLQGGAVAIGSLVGIYPDIQIYGLPFLFHSYDEVDYVRSRMDATLLAGLKEHGFVSFGFGEGGFAYLMSKNPIRSSEELTRQKIWIPQGDKVSPAAFAATDQGADSPAHAQTHPRPGQMAQVGGGRPLCVSCSAHEISGSRCTSMPHHGPLATHASPQPKGRYDMGTDHKDRRRLAPETQNRSSLARSTLCHQSPKVGAERPNRAHSPPCGSRPVTDIPTAIKHRSRWQP